MTLNTTRRLIGLALLAVAAGALDLHLDNEMARGDWNVDTESAARCFEDHVGVPFHTFFMEGGGGTGTKTGGKQPVANSQPRAAAADTADAGVPGAGAGAGAGAPSWVPLGSSPECGVTGSGFINANANSDPSPFGRQPGPKSAANRRRRGLVERGSTELATRTETNNLGNLQPRMTCSFAICTSFLKNPRLGPAIKPFVFLVCVFLAMPICYQPSASGSGLETKVFLGYRRQ